MHVSELLILHFIFFSTCACICFVHGLACKALYSFRNLPSRHIMLNELRNQNSTLIHRCFNVVCPVGSFNCNTSHVILSETNPFVVNTSYNRIEFSESLFNGKRSFSTPGVWAVFSASLSMAWNGQRCVLSFSCLSKVIILFFSFFWHSRGTLRIKIQFDIAYWKYE